MTALTVRLPDEKHRRLKALAKSRGTPLNRLIDEMTTLILAAFDAETRFRLRSARGMGSDKFEAVALIGLPHDLSCYCHRRSAVQPYQP